MKEINRLTLFFLVTALLFSACNNEKSKFNEIDTNWVGTWASAQYYGDETGDAGKLSALKISKTLSGSTLRQIIRTSTKGDQLRLTFSNEFGEEPMEINAARIAKAAVPAKSNINVSTDTQITFNGGKTSVTIPAGKKINSDAVDFPVDALQRIAVSVYFGSMPELVSCHVAARANSFVQYGNVVSNETVNGDVNTHWFVLSNVDIYTTGNNKSIVALGDSHTDGYGVTNEQYTRWTDVLADKLQENPVTSNFSVINMGIGTNKLLNQLNPAAVINRFERDVMNQPNVGYLVFLIGANDMAPDLNMDAMLAAYEEMILKAHNKRIKVYACTLTPNGYENNRRHIINNWLKQQHAQGKLFGLADLDNLLKDPDNPDSLLPLYNNDGIHVNFEGYRMIGEYIYSLILNEL